MQVALQHKNTEVNLLNVKVSLLEGEQKENSMKTVSNEEQLKRIANALEGINTSLDSISGSLADVSVSLDSLDKTLDGCVSSYGNNHFLCITGNVSTN